MRSTLKWKLFVAVMTAAFPIFTGAAEPNTSFEGTISATLTRGGTETTTLVFACNGELLRIENTASKTDPINIVDLATKKLTIVYPHNRTFVQVDLTKKQTQPGMPNLPPGFPTPPTGVGPANTSPPPGFPTAPAMPTMPVMPAMSGFDRPLDLKKEDKTKKIQGFDCTLYTVESRMEKLEIWATNDSSIFPFRMIERNSMRRRFGPQMLEEEWVELLRDKSLFPLEATLRMEGSKQEQFSFKVDNIEKKKIDNDGLFKTPENYQEIRAPQF